MPSLLSYGQSICQKKLSHDDRYDKFVLILPLVRQIQNVMSVIRFIKDWTLAIAIAMGAIFYLTFAFTPSLSAASAFFAPVLDAMLPVFMFLVLFVTFCKVDFRKLRIVPWHLWVSAFQLLTVVLITALVVGFGMTGDSLVLMEAMLICVIGPCASAAAVIT